MSKLLYYIKIVIAYYLAYYNFLFFVPSVMLDLGSNYFISLINLNIL